MRFPELLIVACVSIGLGGCALVPSVPTEPVPVAAAAPLQWQAPLPHRGTVTDLARWWQDLGDPLLADLQEAAQQASPTLASARARIVQSRVALNQTRAAQMPTLDGSVGATRGTSQSATPVTSSVQASLQASWEIDLFGANRLAEDAAQARLDSAQASWHDARVLVAAEVASRYFGQRACEQQ